MIDTDLESCLPILVYDLTCVLLKMSEKLCLQWNDFKENVIFAFGSLREDNNFADVTLACEDGQQVEAHKVILFRQQPLKDKHPTILEKMQHWQFQATSLGTLGQTLTRILDLEKSREN